MYFLDFDRSAFDTETFTAYLRTKLIDPEVSNLSTTELGLAMNALIQEGIVTFAPGELSQFLYEDAARVLRDKENGVMFITFGNPAFQRAKVESAIYGIPRISTIYTGDMRKGDFIGPHIGMYGATSVFVDDTPVELEILAARCPQAVLYEMRRDGGLGDGRWPVIRSLSELP
jgi:hypothetical protein